MSRTTLILAVVLLAVPAAARAQSGAGAAGRSGVDECGAPIARRARRDAGTAAPRTPPRVLGVRSDSAASASHGMAASGQPDGSQGMTPATGSGSGSQGMASSTSGTGSQGIASSTSAPGSQGMASSTSAPGSQGMASSTSGTGSQGMTSSTSGTGSQGMASSTSASGSAVMPMEGTGAAASSTSGAGQTMASSTSAGAGDGMASGTARNGDPQDEAAAARTNRAALRLGATGDRLRLGPAASVSVPTALGVDAGEMFFGVAYQGRTRYTEQDDGAAVFGFGIGSRRVLALEAALTTYSTFRGSPFETGGVSFKLHRALPSNTSVAVGWENALLWGDSDDDGSLYAAATRMVSLRPGDGLFSTGVVTLGVGNGRFRTESDDAAGRESVNVFAAAGVRVNDPVSLVADWTGQDLNAAASITPVRRLPLVVTVGMADITGSAGDGARFILSLGYGLAFPQPF